MTFVYCDTSWCKYNDNILSCCNKVDLFLKARGPYVYVICSNSEFKDELKEEYEPIVEGREQI